MPLKTTLWWVFLGGCLGTALRAGIGAALGAPAGGSWSATLGVNVLGALLLGVLMARLRHRARTPAWMTPLLGVGLLGSFTTYSALAIEANRLGRDLQPLLVVAYPVLSLLLGLAAVTAGLWLGGRGLQTTGGGPATTGGGP